MVWSLHPQMLCHAKSTLLVLCTSARCRKCVPTRRMQTAVACWTSSIACPTSNSTLVGFVPSYSVGYRRSWLVSRSCCWRSSLALWACWTTELTSLYSMPRPGTWTSSWKAYTLCVPHSPLRIACNRVLSVYMLQSRV